MDYEKKYKEALKDASYWMKEKPECKDLLKGIFPELTESEDERIRKWLIEECQKVIDMANPAYDTHKAKEAIAWLEKQKEQKKPILFKRDCTDFEIEVHEIIAQARNDSRLNDADVLKQFEEEAAFALMLKANKLMEQKPAEWAELTWKDIVELEGIINNVHYDFSAGIGQESFGKEVLERFRNKKDDAEVDACEQKSDTRTADDLQLLGFIYDLLASLDWRENYAMSKEECLRRLNEYRPQKPSWSEDWREEDIQTRFAFYTYKDDSSELYLSNVFVEEASRNHGFGTKILRAAEKVAETIGATTICLKVKQDSPANAWYRKNGYGYVTFEDGYDWLEKNLEYMKPNKQEWSEEEAKKAAEDYADEFPGMTHAYNDFLAGVLWAKHHGIF